MILISSPISREARREFIRQRGPYEFVQFRHVHVERPPTFFSRVKS
jgi:hypothetical protein